MTVDEVDVTNVPAAQMAIVQSIRQTVAQVAAMNASASFAKRLDDVSRKLGRLLSMLNRGELDEVIVSKLREMSPALQSGDLARARDVVKRLMNEHWDQNSMWIMGLKRLIEMAQTGK